MTEWQNDDRLSRLTSLLVDGSLSRREFIRKATVLGISGSMIATILAACGGDDDDDGGDATEAEESGSEETATEAESGAEETTTEEADEETSTEAEGEETSAEGGEETSEETEEPESGSEGQPKQGGEIIIGTLGEAQSINPFVVNESEGTWRCSMLYDQFIYIDPETYEVKPKLAKEWTASDDATEFTFTLQDGVTFSDGTPLTMEDISFFIHGVLQPDTASPFVPNLIAIEGAQEYNEGNADTISGVEVVDDVTLTLRLTEPNAAFLVNLENIRPVPKAMLEGKSLKDDAFFQEPIGAGPFKFESWNIGGDFVAIRNETYWQTGKPYLNRFVHRVIADSQTLVLALESGEIHASNYPAPTVAQNLQEIETLEVMVPPFTQPDGWSFNQSHEALANRDVRMAIAMAMDMEQYVADFLLGLGEVGIGPIAPGNWAFKEDLEPIPYDPDQAKQLLADAGYPDGGFSVQFTTNQGNILREDFLTFTQAALEPLGITVEPNLTEWTQVVAAATDGTFEAICPTWSGAIVEPDELYFTLHSGSSRNVYGYSNEEVDSLLEEGRATVDQEKRKEIYGRVQEILMDDIPIFWAWYRPFLHVTSNQFAGYTDSNLTGGLFVNLENWYVKE